jgi:hypothetical protein
MLRHLVLPVIAALVSGDVYLYQDELQAFAKAARIGLAGMCFAIILVLANHVRQSIAQSCTMRVLEANSSYESSITRRLDEINRNLHMLQKSMVTEERLEASQGEIAETVATIAAPSRAPQSDDHGRTTNMLERRESAHTDRPKQCHSHSVASAPEPGERVRKGHQQI